MKRVGIWIRVSTEDQAQGESPKHHKMRAEAYAAAKEWHVMEVYDLSGVSGKTVMEHPETQRMMHDIKRGHISALIFSKLARLARNTKELLEFADFFKENDASLISLQESIDTSTPAGRLFYTIIAAMAEWERAEISSRIAAAIPMRAKLGKHVGGPAPFGYKWEDKEMTFDETEAPIRKHMYELFLEHKRKRTTAKVMNEMGYRTRSGKLFYDGILDRLLRDPIAKGIRRSNYVKSTDGGKGWEYKPQEEWVEVPIEPLITEETWDQVQAVLDASVYGKQIARKPAKHIFTGLTFCECGGVMRVPSNNPKYICVTCKNKIPVEDLEAIYRNELKQFLLSEKHIAEYLHKANEALNDKITQMEVLKKEEKKVLKNMDSMVHLYQNGQISTDAFGRQFKLLEERNEQIKEELPKRQSELDLLKIDNLSEHAILDQTITLNDRWDNLSRDAQFSMVESITERIVVGKDQLSIDFHYLPFFQNNDNKATNP